MKRFLSWLVMLPIAVVAIVFAIVNRQFVTLDAWPFPYVLEAPLFAVVLAAVVLGFLWGGLVAWIAGGKWRNQARLMRSRAEHAERELDFERRKRTRREATRGGPAETDGSKEPAKALSAPRDAA